ncbi:MAG: hypothetical protein ACFCGT_25540 [Sandaracinaceae bacterium]
MLPGRSSVAAALLSALAGAGCVAASDFDPVGNTAFIAGAWTIDGQVPTDDLCGRLWGRVRIQTVFFDERSQTGDGLTDAALPPVDIAFARPVVHTGLVFRCTARQQGGENLPGVFDTRDRRRRVVQEGTWTIGLRAVTGAGRRLSVQPAPPRFSTSTATCSEPVEGVEPDAPCIELPTLDFPTGRILAEWNLGGLPATASRCDDALIEDVGLVFTEATAVADLTDEEKEELGDLSACEGVEVRPGVALPSPVDGPCQVGLLGSYVQPCVRYRARLVLQDGREGPEEVFAQAPFDEAPRRDDDVPRLGGDGFAFDLTTF